MTPLSIIPLFAGWIIGLAINYLSDVLPVTRSFSHPICSRCQQEMGIKEYLFFQLCPNGHKRTIRAWAVQVISIAASVFIWYSPPEKLGYLLGLVLFLYFGIVFVIDLEHRLILHPTSIFGMVLGLITGSLKRGIPSTLLGALAGFVIMLLFYYLGVLFSRYRAQRMKAAGQEPDDEEALGAGDVILVTVLGFITGWPLIWVCLLFGILLGGAVSLLLLVWLVITRKYSTNSLMLFLPYGPYLVTSAFILVFFPDFVRALIPG